VNSPLDNFTSVLQAGQSDKEGMRILFDKNSCNPQHQHACQYAAENITGHRLFDRILLDEFGDLDGDLENSACADGEEEDGKEWRWGISADPCANDGGRASD
jgi:hypothetical protein